MVDMSPVPVHGVMPAVADVDTDLAKVCIEYWVPCVALEVVRRLCSIHIYCI